MHFICRERLFHFFFLFILAEPERFLAGFHTWGASVHPCVHLREQASEGVSSHSLPHTDLRRRSPTAAPHRTTRHSWCCRPCQRWIQEPSILGEVESERQQWGLEHTNKKPCVHSGPKGSPSTSHLGRARAAAGSYTRENLKHMAGWQESSRDILQPLGTRQGKTCLVYAEGP